MIANRVRETSASTGTGNLTLDGAVTNFRTFNTAFGTDRRFYYWIVDGDNSIWEVGIGYLSASTTLVREEVIDNSSGTTSALTLSAGTKDVFNEKDMTGAMSGFYEVNDDATYKYVFPFGDQEASTSGDNPDTALFHAFYLTTGGIFSGMSIEVTTAATSGNVNLGIYSLINGRPGVKIAETGNISVTTTGQKTGSFSGGNIQLNPGWYYSADAYSSSDGVFRAHPVDSYLSGPSGNDGANLNSMSSNVRHNNAGGTALPTFADTSGYNYGTGNKKILGLITA
jgi:hypothetical protein